MSSEARGAAASGREKRPRNSWGRLDEGSTETRVIGIYYFPSNLDGNISFSFHFFDAIVSP